MIIIIITITIIITIIIIIIIKLYALALSLQNFPDNWYFFDEVVLLLLAIWYFFHLPSTFVTRHGTFFTRKVKTNSKTGYSNFCSPFVEAVVKPPCKVE